MDKHTKTLFPNPEENKGEVILYHTDDGRAEIALSVIGDNVWLTQSQIAELFDTTKQNVSLHARNIYRDGEQIGGRTVKEYLILLPDGRRYKTQAYSLPMILAIGYRVRSPRGVQFRQWATRHLEEYLTKGFIMNDDRLKNPGGHDYFDELLARIRDIRASEKRPRRVKRIWRICGSLPNWSGLRRCGRSDAGLYFSGDKIFLASLSRIMYTKGSTGEGWNPALL